MKTTLIVLLILVSGCSLKDEIKPIWADELLYSKWIVDSVLVIGEDEQHDWDFEVTETIPSSRFIADNYRGIRTCLLCGRKEAVHDTTWSEKVRRRK